MRARARRLVERSGFREVALPLTPEAAEGPDEDERSADLGDSDRDTEPADTEAAMPTAEPDPSASQRYWARLDSPGG